MLRHYNQTSLIHIKKKLHIHLVQRHPNICANSILLKFLMALYAQACTKTRNTRTPRNTGTHRNTAECEKKLKINNYKNENNNDNNNNKLIKVIK